MISMRHLLSDWNAVAGRLRAAPAIALFLDFDGTLARLRPRPDQALLHGSVRRVLSVLARCPRFRVWVISGRRLDDVRARIGVPGIHYLGLHGWERGNGNALAGETRQALPRLQASVATVMAAVPGVWVEDKEHAFTVHYGGVSEPDVRRARALLDTMVEPDSRLFRIERGHSVWEVLPRELGDKGLAVRRQLALLSDTAVPVYVGDDRVDEPAFAALREGITVRVGGNGRSRARYRLDGVGEVSAFLQKLREEFA
jgi:trehalose-phosphatase